MESIYIIGAGGAAKEIYLLIKHINAVKKTYDFKGFIDVNSKKDKISIGNDFFPIIEESGFLEKTDNSVSIVFGIGDASLLKRIAPNYIKKTNLKFPNIIDPNIVIDESVSLGKGNVIAASCVLTVDILIGDFNYINRGVHIGHDSVIGSYNILNPCSVISGGVNLENENLIGTNATVLQYLSIGSKNKIGAGAVVTKIVKDNLCLVGVPAKIVKSK